MHRLLPVIRGALFDLDGTLYDYSPCDAAGILSVCAFLANALHIPLPTVQKLFTRGRREVKEVLQRENGGTSAASHHRLLYIQRTIELLTERSQPALALEGNRVFWDAFLRTMAPFPGIHELFNDLRIHGVRVAIVTDMTAREQLEKLIQLQIAEVVDAVVSSEESGAEKPLPDSIRLALKKIRCTPTNSVMIGDDERDIKAAHAAGTSCVALRFTPTDSGAYCVEGIDALRSLLRNSYPLVHTSLIL